MRELFEPTLSLGVVIGEHVRERIEAAGKVHNDGIMWVIRISLMGVLIRDAAAAVVAEDSELLEKHKRN